MKSSKEPPISNSKMVDTFEQGTATTRKERRTCAWLEQSTTTPRR